VKKKAVIGAGVILTGSTPVFDLVKQTKYRKSKDTPLIIPEGAVVVPGSRSNDSLYAREHNLSIYTPIIIKYRDSDTDAATALEENLR